ncbi:unnamed protein product [Pylaiella littoralis]
MGESTAGFDEKDCAVLLRLLKIPWRQRESEDVFEIANSLYRATFIRQLDVATRSGIARCAEAYEILPGEYIHLSREGKNALYIILCGSVKAEAAGLEFLAGDSFGFRNPSSSSFQLMAGNPVVSCAGRGLAVKVPFEHCLKVWPEMERRGSDQPEQELEAKDTEPSRRSPVSFSFVWSPELAKSILLRGKAGGEKALVALEFLNFPPVNGYSPEVREILVSQFQLRRENEGGVFLEWTNCVPVNPNDVRLSRLNCDQVVIVVSGCLKATCRRRKKTADSARPQQLRQESELRVFDPTIDGEANTNGAEGGIRGKGGGGLSEDKSGGRGGPKADPDSKCSENSNSNNHHIINNNNNNNNNNNDDDDGTQNDDGGRGSSDGDGEFTLTRLKPGGVFPPQSGLMMMRGRNRKSESDFDQARLFTMFQEVGKDWEDFDLCALVGDFSATTTVTEVLLVDAHIFHDVIYPGTDLGYRMEPVRDILSKAPGLRTWKEINYVARNVLSHHVAFQQMPALALERVASRLTATTVVRRGEVLAEHGEKVTGFLLLLRGSARVMGISKAREFHLNNFIHGDLGLVRAAEKQAMVDPPVSAAAMRSLAISPERRSRRDVRIIADELRTPNSGLDVVRFRHIPICLKTRIAAVCRLEVLPAFFELRRDEKDAKTHLVIIKGSISLQAVTKSNRFTMENLDMPASGLLKTLDVDSGLALEDWRASGLGPCAAVQFERQVLGEFPLSEESVQSVRAVTRRETTVAVVDSELYTRNLSRVNYSDSHSAICREVLAQLKRCPMGDQTGVGGVEADMLCRLLKENPVLKKRISISCRPRIAGNFALRRYKAGEIVTDEEDFGDNLYIILEGLLEYAVQDTHRGVIDRALAKEVSITPGLRCVGVMTAGDFFAPESMLGKRKGRKPRTLASGSYRIRCSPDVQDGGVGGGGGAICLILPRGKIEAAVHRDHQVKRSLQTMRTTDVATAENSNMARSSGGLGTVSFGGPGELKHRYLSDEKEEGGVLLGGEMGKKNGEKHSDDIPTDGDKPETGAGAPALGGVAGGAGYAGPSGGSALQSPLSITQAARAAAAAAATGTTEATEAAGAAGAAGAGACLKGTAERADDGRRTKEKHAAFLTGVPLPHVAIIGELEHSPETPMDISSTIAELQDRRNPPQGGTILLSAAAAGDFSEYDAGVAGTSGRAAAHDGGGVCEGEGNGTIPAEDMSHSWYDTSLTPSVGNPSEDGLTSCLQQGEQSVNLLTAGAQSWAGASECSGGYSAGTSAGSNSGDLPSWRVACSTFSSAAGEGMRYCASSVLGIGLVTISSGDEEERFIGGVRREGAQETAARGDTSDGLFSSLRSFVASHVDPCKPEPRGKTKEEGAAAWVSPRQDASGRLLSDELELLGKLSGDACMASSGGGSRKVAARSGLKVSRPCVVNEGATEGTATTAEPIDRERCSPGRSASRTITKTKSSAPRWGGGNDTAVAGDAIPPVQPPTWSQPSKSRLGGPRATAFTSREERQQAGDNGEAAEGKGRPGDTRLHPAEGGHELADGRDAAADETTHQRERELRRENRSKTASPPPSYQEEGDTCEKQQEQHRHHHMHMQSPPLERPDEQRSDPAFGANCAFGARTRKRAEREGNTQPTTKEPSVASGITHDKNHRYLSGASFQSQRRPCTGAPSHGWQSLMPAGGRNETVPTDAGRQQQPISRNYVSKVDPTELSTLPAENGSFTTWNAGRVHPGVDVNKMGTNRNIRQEDARNKSSSGVTSRKLPAAVRRLKIALQVLNDSS